MRKFRGVAYCFSFDTKATPGNVVAVSVALDNTILVPTDAVRVDLCDHPLYKRLETYVLANPSSGKKE